MRHKGKDYACPQCSSLNMRMRSKQDGAPRAKCQDCGHHPYLHRCKPVKKLPEPLSVVEEHDLKKRNKDLQRQVQGLVEELQESNSTIGHLSSLRSVTIEPPKWLLKPAKGDYVATPTLFLSDTHFDECVNPAEVNYVNEYDRNIATERLRRFFQRGAELVERSGADVPGIVLPMGGDMVSGSIHEELAESNDAGIMDTVVYWTSQLAAGIRDLAERFGDVYVPCVTGNHGRNTRKVRAKGRAQDNFDWLIYRMLAWHFENDDRIRFNIPLNSDARWNVYDTRYQMTHGDQFRGGSGIGGVSVPIRRGDSRKRNREQATNTPYDILIMGHFHTLMDMGDIIVNGSLKGLDEYAMAGNFGFERPQQAFWLTEPKHGKTMFSPIHVDDGEGLSEPGEQSF